MGDFCSYLDVSAKLVELDVLVATFQDRNKELSHRFGKSETNGRLASKMTDMREELRPLKDDALAPIAKMKGIY